MNTKMRSSLLLLIFFVSCTFYASCRQQDPPKSGPETLPSASRSTVIADPDYDAQLSQVVMLQDSIRANPGDLRIIPVLLTAAFDTNSGSFNVVGKGTNNKAMPEATWITARNTAAKSDALRWALYLKAWRSGNMTRFGKKIEGEVLYSKQLLLRNDGDTTYIMLQVPIGSVIVRE